ncbi:MAG: ZIP family metal transporter [Firmicutes bacterium]|nr:ZIP family metal transporter [Bacillota bacterium]
MWIDALTGIIIPFIGTTLGALCVFFLRKNMSKRVDRMLTGFAGGVMVAASFFSLIVPAIEQSEFLGKFSFIPASFGFLLGILFLIVLDIAIPYIGFEDNKGSLSKTTKLVLAVTIHNLPEGMAVGIVYAGLLYGKSDISVASALALALGIALQNFPEGAIVSMPLNVSGMPKFKAFLYGAASGIVEPVGAIVTVFAAGFFLPLMPYFLSFAAGAMFYVVIEELLPSNTEEKQFSIGTVFFALGFVIMMALDVGLK